jgi:hypothetical protein
MWSPGGGGTTSIRSHATRSRSRCRGARSHARLRRCGSPGFPVGRGGIRAPSRSIPSAVMAPPYGTGPTCVPRSSGTGERYQQGRPSAVGAGLPRWLDSRVHLTSLRLSRARQGLGQPGRVRGYWWPPPTARENHGHARNWPAGGTSRCTESTSGPGRRNDDGYGDWTGSPPGWDYCPGRRGRHLAVPDHLASPDEDWGFDVSDYLGVHPELAPWPTDRLIGGQRDMRCCSTWCPTTSWAPLSSRQSATRLAAAGVLRLGRPGPGRRPPNPGWPRPGRRPDSR